MKEIGQIGQQGFSRHSDDRYGGCKVCFRPVV
jgi:hypothetical protein